MVMAPNAQTFWHLPHPIQPALQAFITTAPLSFDTHDTYTARFFGHFLRSSIIILGHAFTQAPQAVHLSGSTSGSPVAGFMRIASNAHETTQSPNPRQPNAQPVSPT